MEIVDTKTSVHPHTANNVSLFESIDTIMKKHYDVYIMMTSFFLILIFSFTGMWAFTEKIGDGSWNEQIFVGSGIGVIAACITFVIMLILTFVRGWK
jgi:hypothetical protein